MFDDQRVNHGKPHHVLSSYSADGHSCWQSQTRLHGTAGTTGTAGTDVMRTWRSSNTTMEPISSTWQRIPGILWLSILVKSIEKGDYIVNSK